jgi:hypothetical protein
VVSITPRPRLTPGKGPPVAIGEEAGCDSQLVWTQTLEKNPLPLPGIEPRPSSLSDCSTSSHQNAKANELRSSDLPCFQLLSVVVSEVVHIRQKGTQLRVSGPHPETA